MCKSVMSASFFKYIYISIWLSICLSVCWFFCLSVCWLFFSLSLYLSVWLSVAFSLILCLSLSLSLSLNLSLCYLSLCLNFFLIFCCYLKDECVYEVLSLISTSWLQILSLFCRFTFQMCRMNGNLLNAKIYLVSRTKSRDGMI